VSGSGVSVLCKSFPFVVPLSASEDKAFFVRASATASVVGTVKGWQGSSPAAPVGGAVGFLSAPALFRPLGGRR
jgi:hypothetical protein